MGKIKCNEVKAGCLLSYHQSAITFLKMSFIWFWPPIQKRENMATETQIQAAFSIIAERPECRACRISLRFGDLDCAHCGADIEELMQDWAARLVDTITGLEIN